MSQFPKLRRDGILQTIGEWPRLTEIDLHAALERVCQYDAARLHAFAGRGDLDIAYTGDNRSFARRSTPGEAGAPRSSASARGMSRKASEV